MVFGVLAFACRETEEELTKETECHLTFLGLVAMMDPPRPESVEAVKTRSARESDR